MASLPLSVSMVDSTFGCLFLAVVFSSILWGAGSLQLYFYYEKYWKTDQPWLKSYITVIWLLDTAHQTLLVHFTYLNFVRGIADQRFLFLVSKTGVSTALLAAIIDAMIQFIFVRRAWYLSDRNRILAAVLGTAVLAQFVITITYYGQIFHFHTLNQFIEVLHTELILNVIITFTDLLIAVSIICLLWKARSGSGRTDSIVNRLVAYTIGSGLVIAVWTTVGLIGANAIPNSFIYLLVALIFPKLYFNCMLTSLNARSNLRDALAYGADGVSIRFENIPTNSIKVSESSPETSQKSSSPRAIECRVDITTASKMYQDEKPEIVVEVPEEYQTRANSSAV